MKRYALVFIPGLIVLFADIGKYWSSHWYAKWSIIMGFASLCFSFFVGKRTSFVFFPILALSLLSSVYIATWPFPPYLEIQDPLPLISIGKYSLYAYLVLAICSMSIACIPTRFAKQVLHFLASVFGLSAVYMLLQMINHPAYERGAFSGNAGMSACLVVSLMPLALRITKGQMRAWIYVITALTCLASGAAIPLGVFCLTVWAYHYLPDLLDSIHEEISWWSVLILPIIPAFIWLVGYSGIEFFSSSGRFSVWRAVFSFWWRESNVYFGAGLGSGIILFPQIQKQAGLDDVGWYLWLHSDWLQILFELGIVGFVFALSAYIYLLFRAKKSPSLLASLMGFGATALFDYPLRLPIHATAATLVVWLILQGGGIKNGKSKN